MKKEMVCVSCPIGCRLTVAADGDGAISVQGNKCQKGAEYAEAELLNPRRTVTATCTLKSDIHPRLPVRTAEPCPKEMIGEILSRIYGLTLIPPVKAGDVLFEHRGVRVLATRTLEG